MLTTSVSSCCDLCERQRSPVQSSCHTGLRVGLEGGGGWSHRLCLGSCKSRPAGKSNSYFKACNSHHVSGAAPNRPAAWPSAAGWSRDARSGGQSPLSAPGGIFCLLSGCNSRAFRGGREGGGGCRLSCFDFLFTPNTIFLFLSSSVQCVCRTDRSELEIQVAAVTLVKKKKGK